MSKEENIPSIEDCKSNTCGSEIVEINKEKFMVCGTCGREEKIEDVIERDSSRDKE